MSEPATKELKWFYADHEESESWSGALDTREDAIAEGLAEDPEREGIWVNEGEPVTVEDAADWADDCEVERIVEQLTDYLSENGMIGEDTSLDVADKQAAADALADWIRKFVTVEPWYTMVGKAEYVERDSAGEGG